MVAAVTWTIRRRPGRCPPDGNTAPRRRRTPRAEVALPLPPPTGHRHRRRSSPPAGRASWLPPPPQLLAAAVSSVSSAVAAGAGGATATAAVHRWTPIGSPSFAATPWRLRTKNELRTRRRAELRSIYSLCPSPYRLRSPIIKVPLTVRLGSTIRTIVDRNTARVTGYHVPGPRSVFGRMLPSVKHRGFVVPLGFRPSEIAPHVYYRLDHCYSRGLPIDSKFLRRLLLVVRRTRVQFARYPRVGYAARGD